jgi:Glycosyltransferase family 28 C-terminal domain
MLGSWPAMLAARDDTDVTGDRSAARVVHRATVSARGAGFTRMSCRAASMCDVNPVIDLVYFNAGGGHRAAATALREVVREQRRPWTMRMINLFEVLDPGQRFKRTFGLAPEDLYNRRLASGSTVGMRHELKLLQGLIRLADGPITRRLVGHWTLTQPDLVVSLIPNFNRSLYGSVRRALPGVPYVTVLTDMADYPPHFWMEPGQDQHLVCGTERAVQQAQALGYAEHQIHRVNGMILRPDFYRGSDSEPVTLREQLGLHPMRPVGLVMFGGHGAMQMVELARAMPDVQLILICGHNVQLAQALRDLRRPAPHAVVGFTDEVSRYMMASDFFIGKPGPGCLSEAVQCGLPIVTFANRATIPQECFNADWVSGQGLGVVVESVQRLPQGVMTLLPQLQACRERVRAQRIRAVFEVPDVLAGVLRTYVAREPVAGQAAMSRSLAV